MFQVSNLNSRPVKAEVEANNKRNESCAPPQQFNLRLPLFPHQQAPLTQGTPVGGRLSGYWKEWQARGAHPWVVGVLRWGYCIQFSASPPVSRHPTVASGYADPVMDASLAEAIDKLLQKQAIEEVYETESRGFYSRLFLRPKASGGWRPIIDLKPLNPFIMGSKIKQETQAQIRSALSPNQWTFSIDLTDAFFHVPIHRDSRRYLRFQYKGRVFQYRALPFGLKTAPWIFTAVMAQIQSMPETRDIKIHLYLDDWIVPVSSFTQGVTQASVLLQLCRTLGLMINLEKSDLIPSQVFVHLGVHYNLLTYRAQMSQDNIEELRLWGHKFLSGPPPSARTWLGVIGFLYSQVRLTEYGRLRIRQIQWALKEQWVPASGKLDQRVPVTTEAREAMSWWLTRDNIDRGSPIRPQEASVLLQTDASMVGWGGHSGELSFHGTWDLQESQLHINVLEMRAVFNSLKKLDPPPQSVVMVATDNTTVMAHIIKQGGTKSLMMHEETQRLLLFAESKHWFLLSKHVPGRLNILADQLSRRGQSIQTEWELLQEVAQSLFDRWGQPLIDLFATRLNTRLPLFYSPVPDPLALGVDALSVSWENLDCYAFPPHRIIPQVLHKFRQTLVMRLILVTPLWE